MAVQSWDAVGATEKITRLNTAPMFLFAAGVLGWVIFRESAGRILLVRGSHARTHARATQHLRTAHAALLA